MNIQLTNPIVTTDWLHEHMNATNLVILNGTIPKVVGSAIAETQQIPNARFFDIKKVFSVSNAPFPNTMLTVENFTQKAKELGIHQDSAIVVYDELGMYAAPRVWYMFQAVGFHNIAVLDGGFPLWKEKGYPCEDKITYNGESGNFAGKDQLYLFKNYEDMLQEITNETSIILDARSHERFTGKVPEPRKGLRSGQIPTSKNLPYTALLNNNQLKPKTEIKAILESLQDNSSQFVFSCGSGITACILALAANYAGYDNYAVYDGSWTEWGSLYKED